MASFQEMRVFNKYSAHRIVLWDGSSLLEIDLAGSYKKKCASTQLPFSPFILANLFLCDCNNLPF